MSRDGFEGDAVAQGGELRDVVTGSAFNVDAGRVVVGTEVVETGRGVVQQVPDDDQDRPGNSDEGLELAAAFDDAPIAVTEEGVGLGSGCRGLSESTFQIGVAFARLARTLHRTGLDGAWTQFRPRHQVPGRGELAHVEPDFGENDLRVHRADAGNLIESLDRGQLAGVAAKRGLLPQWRPHL